MFQKKSQEKGERDIRVETRRKTNTIFIGAHLGKGKEEKKNHLEPKKNGEEREGAPKGKKSIRDARKKKKNRPTHSHRIEKRRR